MKDLHSVHMMVHKSDVAYDTTLGMSAQADCQA